MAAPRPNLRKLAEKLGIMSSYVDANGVRRFTSDATRVALVEAMGWDGSTETAANCSVELIDRKRRSCTRTVRVVTESRNLQSIVVQPPDRTAKSVPYSGWLLPPYKSGNAPNMVKFEGNISHLRTNHQQTAKLPIPLKRGESQLRLRFSDCDPPVEMELAFLVVPARCWMGSTNRVRRSWVGVSANLYTVLGERNWGVGDLSELKHLIRWAGVAGCDFVGINPIHATENQWPRISPYQPSSREFPNPLYIDVESVPEFEYTKSVKQLYSSLQCRNALSRLRHANAVDYDTAYSLKLRVMRLLFDEFSARNLGKETDRGRAFAKWKWGRAGYFGVYCALHEHLRATKGLTDWRQWPPVYRDPWSQAVRKFEAKHKIEVEFHRFLQFELNRQLTDCSKLANRSGLIGGLYHDLAVGSASDGFDAWINQELFAPDIEVGSPPDAHSKAGQNWSFAPIDPHKLAEDGFFFWQCLLQSAMRTAGMLRIDHAMGLMRQFWIPKGRPPSEGAYVKYPFDEMVGVLALESHNHKCLVVGEDLGTVPKGFSELLEKRGILSTRMMMFERSRNGGFKSAKSYQRSAVTSATNHDLPPLRGYVEASDLELRQRIGLFKSKAEWLKALDQRKRDVKALLRRLVQEKLLSREEARDPAALSHHRLVEAVHGFLAKTPARVIAVMLDDLFGESEPINLPGVGPDQHASWTRRMSRSLEDGLKDKKVVRLLKAAMPKKRARWKKIRK